jgi:hypothetical protein
VDLPKPLPPIPGAPSHSPREERSLARHVFGLALVLAGAMIVALLANWLMNLLGIDPFHIREIEW